MSTRIGAAARGAAYWTLAQALLASLLFVAAFAARAATPQLAYADFTGCLLKQDGSVTCWGYGDNGQTSPPAGPFDQISMGAWSGCGLRPSGQVECWGGQGLSGNIGGLTDVPPGSYTQIDAGGYFHCAIRDDEKVVCWGTQVGGEWVPYQGVDDLFVRVSTGSAAFCAIRTNGELVCNGFNPPVPPAGSYIDVFAGAEIYCALRPDHQLECWGYDAYGQTNPPPGQFVWAGVGAHHACGIRMDGTLSCWGYFGNQDYRQYFPPAGQYSSLGVGYVSNCALRVDGVVKCWGMDGAGEAPRFRIDPKVIEAAQVGVSYSIQLSMVDKGTIWTSQPYQPLDPLFATSAGQLPPNFSLSGTGLLEGTAAAPGEWMVTLLGQDARGFEVERDVAFTVVNPGQDTTPPVITPHLTGLNQALDWYRSDVTVEWQVEDPESGATTQVGCQTTIVDADTPITGIAFECAARSIGGVSYETVELRRDATPPTVQINSVEPQPDAPGYYIAYYSATDALSTVAFTECALDDPQSFAFCQPIASNRYSHQFGPIDSEQHTLYVRAADNAANYSDAVSFVINGPPSDATPPIITPSVTGTLGSSGWYTSDIAISWSVADNESSISSTTGCDATLVAVDTSGIAFTCQATSAGGTSQNSVTVKRDTQAPDTTITGSPPNPSSLGSVTFTFSGSDAISGVAGFACSLDGAAYATCTSPRTISGLGIGSHTFAVRAIDSAGLVDATSEVYTWTMQSDDTVAPVANPAPTKQPNQFGWYNKNVTVNWNWTDAGGSGIDPTQCTTASTSNGEGLLTLSATCRDLAGNIGTASRQVRVDKASPTLSPFVSPTQIRLNGSGSTVIGASDGLSGIDTQGCAVLVTNTVGMKTVTCTATDRAGNVGTAKAAYEVVYGFDHYNSPIQAPPQVNVVRRNQGFPLRWRLVDANAAPIASMRDNELFPLAFVAPPEICNGGQNQITATSRDGKLRYLGNGNYEVGVAFSKQLPPGCYYSYLGSPVEAFLIIFRVTQ